MLGIRGSGLAVPTIVICAVLQLPGVCWFDSCLCFLFSGICCWWRSVLCSIFSELFALI